MNSKQTSQTEVRELGPGEPNFTAEAKRIQNLALSGQCHVIRLGEIVFFSTRTGDAWMLDSEDHYAVCLARDYEFRPIPITESAERMAVEWNADYEIQGSAFTVSDRKGNERTILGYPTAEIERLLGQVPARPEDLPPEVGTALARLKTGRNEACPCGSGRKYKKCCLAKDEAAARKLSSSGTSDGKTQRKEVEVDASTAAPAEEHAAPVVLAKLDENEGREEEQDVSDDDDDDDDDDAVAAYDPALSEEDNRIVNAWWDRVHGPYMEESNGGEVLRHLTEFLEEHPRLFPHLGVEDELLLELEAMLTKEGRNADYVAFLRRLRREQPEAYERCFGWFDYALIGDAVARRAHAEIPEYFSFFRQDLEARL